MLPKFVRDGTDVILLQFFSLVPPRIVRRILWLLHTHPEVGDRWGYHIRQNHFYEPWPIHANLTIEQVLKRRENLTITWQLEKQLSLLQELKTYSDEIVEIKENSNVFDFYNGVFYELDPSIYYALIRYLKPKTVVEIGSGYSTQIGYRAIAKNCQENAKGQIICIEPYPPSYLTDADLDIHLIEKRLEEIDLSLFQKLQAGDILFIDSTHTVKFGSDVCREVLDILPTLASGVWVHIHDIFFPLDYPPKWLIEERRAWNEQYLVEAFLSYNSAFEVRLANHWLSLDYPEQLASLWPEVLSWESPHQCGSLWLRKK